MKFQHILVTTDYSDESFRAFALAHSMAKRDGSKITLLSILEQIIDPGAAPWGVPSASMVPELREQMLKGARAKVEELRSRHFGDLPSSAEVFFGNHSAAHEITAYAKKNSVDLIVMASHGRGAVAGLLLGSVVTKTIKLASCPILIAPKS